MYGGAAGPTGPTGPRGVIRVSQESSSGSAVINPQVSNLPIATYYNLINLTKELSDENKGKLDELVLNYFKWQIDETQNIFERQKKFGTWIFVVVLFLVALGIISSGIQFWNAFQLGTLEQLHTEVAIQSGNLALSTSLVGGFILIVSLAFFYLFLRYVYKGDLPPNDIYSAFSSLKGKKNQSK